MRLYATLVLAKLVGRLSRVFGRSGQAMPGLIAERLDPQLMSKLSPQLPKGVILITGTNGKTTTTKQVVTILEAAGERVLTNSTGSNLKRGIVSAFVGAADWRGRLADTVGVFEVDEASLRHVAPQTNPRRIVVLNLFRDQLDRYGELDTTAAMIGQGIAGTQAQLFLNADDPLVASLAKYASEPDRVTYFGIEGRLPEAVQRAETVADSDRCPVCHERLKFSLVYYGHVGHYECTAGDFVRPRPHMLVTKVAEAGLSGAVFELGLGKQCFEVRYPLPGTYNLYNALAAASVTAGLAESGTIVAVLQVSEAAFGRVERIELGGRKLCLLLIKNPAGFTQVLETFLLGRRYLRILLVINDLDADGRDVSWLWDVPLELLAETEPDIGVAGIRAADMALRLKYAGSDAWVADDLPAAIHRVLKSTKDGEEIYVLPTYTAMNEVRGVLSKLTHIARVR